MLSMMSLVRTMRAVQCTARLGDWACSARLQHTVRDSFPRVISVETTVIKILRLNCYSFEL